MISEEYINSNTKIDYVCPLGHIHYITWDSWKQGHRCKFCAGQGKPNIEEIRSAFALEGYTLITEHIINDKHKLNYECPKGHNNSMRWNNWRIGRRCPTCKGVNHSKNKSGPDHYNWKGGVTPFNKELRNFISKIGWSSYVLRRDNYTCCMCGIRGCNLVAHHIMPLEKMNSLRATIHERCSWLGS